MVVLRNIQLFVALLEGAVFGPVDEARLEIAVELAEVFFPACVVLAGDGVLRLRGLCACAPGHGDILRLTPDAPRKRRHAREREHNDKREAREDHQPVDLSPLRIP